MRFLVFFFLAWKAYRNAGDCGSYYAAATREGVPQLAVFVATGREAWRVSIRAVEEFKSLKEGQ